MKAMYLIISIMCLVTVLSGQNAEEKGLSIAKKIDAKNKGFIGESSTMTMTLINAYGDEVLRKLSTKTLETKNDGDKSISIFLEPKDVKGTKMLTHSKKVGNDLQWLYLPASKRITKITSRSKSGSFMGSEFSYEDLGSDEIEKYNYKFLKDEQHEDVDCHVLQRIPVDPKSGYSKQITWIEISTLNTLKVDYYDLKGDLLKTATFHDYKKFGKFYRPSKLHMVNQQTEKESILEWNDRKLAQKFSNSDFGAASLED